MALAASRPLTHIRDVGPTGPVGWAGDLEAGPGRKRPGHGPGGEAFGTGSQIQRV